MEKTDEWNRIQAAVHKLKMEWELEYPICIFCLQRVRQGAGQLAHKIRRSDISRIFSTFTLQTMKKNTGLSHPVCHNIWDNQPELRKSLPGYPFVMRDIEAIDPEIYVKLKTFY